MNQKYRKKLKKEVKSPHYSAYNSYFAHTLSVDECLLYGANVSND